MSTLLEIISAARDMLPGVAEAEARAAIERPANPNAAIFDQARAQAEQQGKSHFTFMGRAVETKGGETFDQLRARFPQGELDEGATVAATSSRANQKFFQQRVDDAVRGRMEDYWFHRSQGGTLLNDIGMNPGEKISRLSLAATKSKAVPISEVSQLKALVDNAHIGMKYGDSVLEREGLATAGKWLKRAKFATVGKASTLLRQVFAGTSREDRSNQY